MNVRADYKSINNNEYICTTCKEYITKGIVPRLSVKMVVVFLETH